MLFSKPIINKGALREPHAVHEPHCDNQLYSVVKRQASKPVQPAYSWHSEAVDAETTAVFTLGCKHRREHSFCR
jgi:hypothetical protein